MSKAVSAAFASRGDHDAAPLTKPLTLKFSRVPVTWPFAKPRGLPIFAGMKTCLTLALALGLASAASGVSAQSAGSSAAPIQAPVQTEEMILDAAEVDLNDLLWLKRPLVVFADSPADPRYVQQMQLLTERLDVLDERDVVIVTDTDPDARSQPRRQLRPRGFMTVVLAKDGSVVLRKPETWAVRELTRNIDKLPLRQQEVRDRRDALRQ